MEQDHSFSRPRADHSGAFGIYKAPSFASLREESAFLRVWSNLAACISIPPKAPVNGSRAAVFRSGELQGGLQRRSLLASILLHVGVIACLLNLPSLPNPLADRSPMLAPSSGQKVLWYSKAELLPSVSPPPESRRHSESMGRRTPQRRDKSAPAFEEKRLAFALQEIVSRPPQPDNRRQTIVQPDAPNVRILAHVQIPNLVSWTGVVVPPTPTVSEAKRQLAQIGVPKLPAPVVSPPPPPEQPKPPEINRQLSELRMAAAAAADPAKRINLPVPQGTPSLGSSALAKTTAVPAPPALTPEINQEALRNVIAVGIAPAPSQEAWNVPPGNRAGEFAASPKGSADEKAAAGGDKNASSGGNQLPELGGQDLADIHVPNLSISGERTTEPPGPTEARAPEPRPPATPSPASRENLANLMAKATRPSLLPERSPLPEISRGKPLEPAFFGGKRVYTVLINMPNLTSGSGSWVLEFSELYGDASGKGENDDLSSPVAVRKVDPRYNPAAVRERVEGNVTLAAYILRDGSVTNIRVLRSLDPRLDSSAMEALTDWKFLPAKKSGNPVDLEVLVQIPFRLPTF
jgi:TonB family protein